MPSDSSGIQVDGSVLDQNNLFDLSGPSMSSGGDQHDVTADLSALVSRRCD
eukprot:SAG31_NODE_2660_length_5284_cov_14.800000_5_plen_51_part_00